MIGAMAYLALTTDVGSVCAPYVLDSKGLAFGPNQNAWQYLCDARLGA